jgi:hypothetical protein
MQIMEGNGRFQLRPATYILRFSFTRQSPLTQYAPPHTAHHHFGVVASENVKKTLLCNVHSTNGHKAKKTTNKTNNKQ